MMNKNCLLCGVGGQGVVLASKLIAYAAIEKGLSVRSSETIGMAQRGGSVVSHVRIGEQVHAPLIPKGKADVLIAFEPAEAVRNLSYLKADGVIIVNQKAVKPVTATLSERDYGAEDMLAYLKESGYQVYVVDGDTLCRKAGSKKVLNVALLGVAAACGILSFDQAEMEQIIRANVKPDFTTQNLMALALGAQSLA